MYVQFDAPYRMMPKDLKKIYIRNLDGKMVPFSAVAKGKWIYGPQQLERYNGFPSMNIWGEPAPGFSTGDAMKVMEELATKLPKDIGYAWTGLSYQEKMATSRVHLYMDLQSLLYFWSLQHFMRAGQSQLQSCSPCHLG